MRKTLLDKMCCPFDKNDLHVTIYREEQGEILEGIMLCQCCNRYYPIIYGIPIMTPDEYRQQSLELPVIERWGLTVDAGQPDRFVLTNAEKLMIDSE